MIRHRLNRTLTVYRPSAASDGAGGETLTYPEAGWIRAQVSQPSAAERQVAAQQGAALAYVVHTTETADVERGDLLESEGLEQLRVISVVTNSRMTYRRLECEAVQAGG